jgi:hypothetical protein
LRHITMTPKAKKKSKAMKVLEKLNKGQTGNV